jgi:alpha-glucosidase (family GH31 glycosyl hydrolase)
VRVRRGTGAPQDASDIAAPAAGGPWTLTEELAPEEHLFGLGQDNHNNGRLDRRGVVRELWAGQQISSGNVTAEYPVPLLLSTGRDGHAYGFFFDNVHRLRFDLGKVPGRPAAPGRGRAARSTSTSSTGPRLADVIERYTALTGRPSLPPLWALGYWQSKCTYYDWNALDEAYNQLTARGFPVDVMVIDADWPEVVTDYVWAKRWIDTAHGLTPAAEDRGLRQEGRQDRDVPVGADGEAGVADVRPGMGARDLRDRREGKPHPGRLLRGDAAGLHAAEDKRLALAADPQAQ